MFKEKMVTTAIPERVFALCKIVEKGPVSNAEIKEKMEPDYLENKSSYFVDYRKAAEELGLISVSDDIVTLAVEPQVVKNLVTMRKFVNASLEKHNSGQFYGVTKAYFEKGSDMLKGDKNIANMGPLFSDIIGMPVDAMAMRAWRFWATFLGFGYLQDMFVIPNASVFLSDVIGASNIEKKRLYSVSEFVNMILPKANIIIPDVTKKKFSYGVSNGLRALQDAGKIKMQHIYDQEDLWTLYPLKSYSNDSTITHVTLL